MNPFQAEGEWLRCALHAHTTNSDGEASPAELVVLYEGLGFDVLAITDHWVRTVEPSTDSLLVIPGAELNATAGGPDEDAHVLALGIDVDPEPPEYTFAPLDEVVGWIAASGGLPYLAHTYWSGLRTEQWEDCDGLLGIEVYNAGCDLELGRGDSGLQWDEALARGRRLHGLAADDSHHPRRDSGLAWTWVRCPEQTQEAVLDALRAGSFYGSCGPRDPLGRGRRQFGLGALQPGRERDALLRPADRVARERRAVPAPLRDSRPGGRRPHGGAPGAAVERGLRPGRAR